MKSRLGSPGPVGSGRVVVEAGYRTRGAAVAPRSVWPRAVGRLRAHSAWLAAMVWLSWGWEALAQSPVSPSFASQTSVRQARVVKVEGFQVLTDFRPIPDRVQEMVRRGIRRVTGETNEVAGWKKLVKPEDRVGIKVMASPGPVVGTRIAVVEAVVQGLLEAGLPAERIVIWDRYVAWLREAGFEELKDRYGVGLAGAVESGFDSEQSYETPLLGRLMYGDLEFGKKGEGVGRKSFLSRLVSRDLTRIISIAPLLNHNDAGVSGHLMGLAMGSVDNTLRFEADRTRLDSAVPEIFGQLLFDRLALCITDALLCQYHGEEKSLLHYSVVLNQLWFGRDPVALDVLAVDELAVHRSTAKGPLTKPRRAIYENAALLELGVADARLIVVERGDR